jgi:hypothetical protein
MELGGNIPGDWEDKLSLVFGKKDLAIEDHPDQPMVADPSNGNDDIVTLPFPNSKQQTRRLLPGGPTEELGGRRSASPRRKPRSLNKN